jgi:hypothetical protein
VSKGPRINAARLKRTSCPDGDEDGGSKTFLEGHHLTVNNEALWPPFNGRTKPQGTEAVRFHPKEPDNVCMLPYGKVPHRGITASVTF